MATFTDVAALIPTLRARVGSCASLAQAQTAVSAMTDAEAVAILREADEVAQHAEQLRLIALGVVSARSGRDAGHSGAAQKHGHRNAVSLVQQITGTTKSDAARQVRVAEAMLDGETDATEPNAAEADATARPTDWRGPLRGARRDGRISTAQFDVIQRGLGEVPLASEQLDESQRRDLDETARAAWSQAAQQLIEEAPERTVEELASAARAIRDLLDPDGAEQRFLVRYEKRSYREWIDQYGVRRASIAYEDHGASLLDTIFNAGLRPRRGGPRFVDSEERAQAAALADDPRTNEQLQYDFLIDLVRAGALADAKDVFGTRQAGVRVVQVIDSHGGTVGYTEDGLSVLPDAAIDQQICETGTIAVGIDARGNPLDVGREQRLYTPKQRIALAIRDGGCRWTGCDRPASYCESHHADEWQRDGGRTDIDRGILLCRYHHMQLHHGGWRIARDGKGDFLLHDPGGEARALRPRGFLAYAWGDIDPSPQRFRPMIA
ncbi:putative HNH endonuclease domain protein [Microbacterium esteraromaticum]|uniref:Putative HNH endonuclease domain protein n=1 Tax=Microbacterium esteraromaticum TaxID=57043 RepID=A0A1R4KQQ3_9MICO|nr:HNH endonuclease signature motif containing protein [Microbacterium esteraromaticum]SJN46579.1 putative HNH endonuclease domain protein [Microbacterium esteraromaticum]